LQFGNKKGGAKRGGGRSDPIVLEQKGGKSRKEKGSDGTPIDAVRSRRSKRKTVRDPSGKKKGITTWRVERAKLCLIAKKRQKRASIP